MPFTEATKLFPKFVVETRPADNARRFCVDLANRIALPMPTDTGEREGIIPQISTDGFAAYPEAIDLAFGSYCVACGARELDHADPLEAVHAAIALLLEKTS